MTKEFYTTRDIGKMLNIRPQTVCEYIRKGKIKALLINHAYIVTKSDLDNYLDARNAKGKRENGNKQN